MCDVFANARHSSRRNKLSEYTIVYRFDYCVCQMSQVVHIGLVCFVCATLGQQLKYIQQAGIGRQLASDRLHWHDSNVHKQEWNHDFSHQVQNDFVETVHVIFMNHLGMECRFRMASRFLYCDFTAVTLN